MARQHDEKAAYGNKYFHPKKVKPEFLNNYASVHGRAFSLRCEFNYIKNLNLNTYELQMVPFYSDPDCSGI